MPMPLLTEFYQDAGDFFELRKKYRAEALTALRLREGIAAPELVDGRWQYRDAEGKLHPWAVGARKQPAREVMDAFWDGNAPFEILQVSEDGVPIAQELRD